MLPAWHSSTFLWLAKTPSDLKTQRFPIIREIMVATAMNSLFVALFALLASSFRTRAALQAEILALRHQLAIFQKNAPRRLRLDHCDRLLGCVVPILVRLAAMSADGSTPLGLHEAQFIFYIRSM